MRILCIGDVVGSVGCRFLRERLPSVKRFNGVDLVICVHRPEKPLLDAMQKYGIGCIASGILPGCSSGGALSSAR